jgi:hypothetical protein
MDSKGRQRAGRRPMIGLVIAIAAIAAAVVAAPAQAARDRNHDRLPDRWERHHNLSLKQDQAKRDQDRDGLENLGEFKAGLDPRDADSDDDGTEDGDEGAGTIASFDGSTHELTIDLFGGGKLTGTVTADTRIKCEDEADDEDGHHGGGNSGPGSGEDRRSRDGGSQCGVADLTPGAVVSEAEVEAEGGDAVFEEVELR